MSFSFEIDVPSVYLGVALTLAVFVALFIWYEPMVEKILGPKYPSLSKGIIVVTGSSSGIGLDASIHLAEQGFYVFACVRKEADFIRLEEMKKKNLYPLILDVNKQETIQSAYKTVQKRCEETDLPFAGLINNAGVSFSNPVEFSAQEDARWLMDTNFFGVAFTTKEFLPLIRKHKSRIIIIGSVLGSRAQPGLAYYSASIFAVRGFAEALRLEMQMHGVSVSLIEPGFVKTKIIEKTKETIDQNKLAHKGLTEYYGRLYSDAVMKMREQELEYASPTTVSSAALTHAMTSTRPKTRYPIATIGILPVSVASSLRRMCSDRVLDWYTLTFKYPRDHTKLKVKET